MPGISKEVVNNEERAYVLGWISLVGDKAPDALKHREARWLKDALGEYDTLKDASNLANVKTMPEWLRSNPALGWAFVRGYFDHHGQIGEPDITPICKLYGNVDMLSSIVEFASIPAVKIAFDTASFNDKDKDKNKNKDSDVQKSVRPVLLYKSTNAIDFLGKIYTGARIFWTKRRSQYLDLLSFDTKRVPHVYFTKVREDAVVPSKTHTSDVGYDLTIVAEHKKINSVTTLYDTGIRVRADHGWYVEVVPRSSIVKSGYMLTNGQGIIDPSYQGSILVALTKVDPEAAPIELPFRGFQIILRKHHHALWIEGADVATARKDGGFGSTN